MTDNTSNAPLDWSDIKKSAAAFAIKYKNARKEASLKQPFWIDFMAIFGINATELGVFEYYVKYLDGCSGEIDYFWPGKVIIEHKSSGKDLDKALEQVMNYVLAIENHNDGHRDTQIQLPKYVIVSDFQRIRLINIKAGERDDITIKLEELPNEIEKFGFLAGYTDKRIEGQHPVNIKAAEAIGELYDLLKESNYPDDKLDRFLIRLVFCLFAEDAEIFEKNYLTEYLVYHSSDDGANIGGIFNEVFSVLNTPIEERQKNMSQKLQNFPYVNGGLFEETLPVAYFNREMRDCFFRASKLDWRFISPAIFGSLFQFIMDPKKRRQIGAHYTSEENILKVINPLFMDDLRSEYNLIKGNKKKLIEFWDKISRIRVLDPACGCGNFLIITYRELRILEMDVMSSIYGTQMVLDTSHLHVDHFYGIEYETFPALIANVSILLMDHIMNMEARKRFGDCRSIIPLKEKANIVCGNSLSMDWSDPISPESLSYIVGNPPFRGKNEQTSEQKEDMKHVFVGWNGVNDLDYVSAWYVKASEYMKKNPKIHSAFVSTNSIVQGEQVQPLWQPLFTMGIRINFAYNTFKWSNEAKGVAAVHVVIIGFSFDEHTTRIYSHAGDRFFSTDVKHINAYLVEFPPVFLKKRSGPLCIVPPMKFGNMPNDGGHLLLSEAEKNALIQEDSRVERFIYKFVGAREFINNEQRWCIWLKNAQPSEIRDIKPLADRIDAVRAYRASSKRKETRELASIPYLFGEIRQSEQSSIVVPRHSSETRCYIPMGFVKPDVIIGDSNLMISGASLYHMGIVMSKMHMVWMRYVCGRIKSDYRYSAGIVYNNYPWPDADEKTKIIIEEKVQRILDVRDQFEGQSLADLYDSNVMPSDLLKAHQILDREVEKAYRKAPFKDDEERIAFLFELYNNITESATMYD